MASTASADARLRPLPNELLTRVAEQLPVSTLKKLRLVNRAWQDITVASTQSTDGARYAEYSTQTPLLFASCKFLSEEYAALRYKQLSPSIRACLSNCTIDWTELLVFKQSYRPVFTLALLQAATNLRTLHLRINGSNAIDFMFSENALGEDAQDEEEGSIALGCLTEAVGEVVAAKPGIIYYLDFVNAGRADNSDISSLLGVLQSSKIASISLSHVILVNDGPDSYAIVNALARSAELRFADVAIHTGLLTKLRNVTKLAFDFFDEDTTELDVEDSPDILLSSSLFGEHIRHSAPSVQTLFLHNRNVDLYKVSAKFNQLVSLNVIEVYYGQDGEVGPAFIFLKESQFPLLQELIIHVDTSEEHIQFLEELLTSDRMPQLRRVQLELVHESGVELPECMKSLRVKHAALEGLHDRCRSAGLDMQLQLYGAPLPLLALKCGGLPFSGLTRLYLRIELNKPHFLISDKLSLPYLQELSFFLDDSVGSADATAIAQVSSFFAGLEANYIQDLSFTVTGAVNRGLACQWMMDLLRKAASSLRTARLHFWSSIERSADHEALEAFCEDADISLEISFRGR